MLLLLYVSSPYLILNLIPLLIPLFIIILNDYSSITLNTSLIYKPKAILISLVFDSLHLIFYLSFIFYYEYKEPNNGIF